MAVVISNVSISAASFAIGESGTITFTVKNTNSWTAKSIEVRLERSPSHSTGEAVMVVPMTAISLAKNASKTYTRTFTVTSAVQGAFDYYDERAFAAHLLVALDDGGSNFDGASVSSGATILDLRYVPSIPTFAVERTPNADSTGAAVDIACTLAEGADPEYEDLALTLKWKEEDAASFPAGNTLAVTVADALAAGGTTVTPNFTFETGNAYTLRATFTDGIDSAFSEIKLSKAEKTLNVHPTSKNIGLGQFAVADLDEDDVKRLDMTYRPYFHEGARDADGNPICANKYSSDPVIVGEWKDGKPIYRKVLTFSFSGSTTTVTPSVGETAVETIVALGGTYLTTSDSAVPIPRAHDSNINNQIDLYVTNVSDDPSVGIKRGSSVANGSGHIIIEYTLPTT